MSTLALFALSSAPPRSSRSPRARTGRPPRAPRAWWLLLRSLWRALVRHNARAWERAAEREARCPSLA